MSQYFKIVLLVRFVGYVLFILGFLAFVAVLGPVAQAEFGYRWDNLLNIKHVVPNVVTSNSSQSGSASPSASIDFASLQSAVGETITPVSTEFGIVIEKINANAKIIDNVDPGNEKQYDAALMQGVAHAAGTSYPGQVGNMYLFSHSTDAPWNIVRYNAIFYLLRELEAGDRVIIFYKNKRYDYIVFDKTIANPNDVSFLTNKYSTPVLTLQTCDPPGTLLHRLIVRARLAGT